MILLQLRKQFCLVPGEWNELSGRQLIAIMAVFYAPASDDARLKLFKIISGCSWWRLWRTNADEINDALYLTQFLLQDNTLTKNLLPSYKGMYGPGDDFCNLLTCEFAFTEFHYEQYNKGDREDVNSLHSLLAILYRPAKDNYDKILNPEGDIREAYNDNLTKHYASMVARWPEPVKYSILQWYEGCRQKLQADNGDVFGSGSGSGEAKYGLWSIMRAVAEKSIHGKMKEVEAMYAKVFMMELNEMIDEAKKIEEQLKQQPSHG